LRQTRHIFVEGINGSGKSSTARFLTDYLSGQKIPARYLPEGGPGHPIRMANSLPHPFQIWRDITTDEFIRLSLRKWESFANTAQQSNAVTVCDGLLFHGNMMDLLLMNAEPKAVQAYIKNLVRLLRELHPVLIYLYQDNVEQALRRVGTKRGDQWILAQAQWKLATPYGRERGLEQMTAFDLPGFGGLIHLFTAFRSLCDEIVCELPIPTLRMDNTKGAWAEYYREILSFLELPLDGYGVVTEAQL
jgi:thymidylate kinase